MTYFRVLLLICLMLTPAWANTPLGSANLVVDGNMAKVGVADWRTYASVTITKDTTDPYRGTQNLRLTYVDQTTPNCFQIILTIGKTYRITGWGRGDGTYYPKLYIAPTFIWNGSVANVWQPFDLIVTATSASFVFSNSLTGAGYVEWDDIRVVEVID